MGVPTSGSFNMFGNSDNSTIQGAITQGGGSVASADDFNELIAASNVSLFNTTHSGNLSGSLSNVTNALQYRGYPLLESKTLCFHVSSFATACSCSGNTDTYYLISGTGNTLNLSSTLTTDSSGNNIAPEGYYANGADANGGQVYFWNGSNAWNVDSSGSSVVARDCPSP